MSTCASAAKRTLLPTRVAVRPISALLPQPTAHSPTRCPPTLANGAPRPLSYFVELRNRNGRSAGLSNAAVVLAGEAPPPVSNLTAELRKRAWFCAGIRR